jgi:hydrogenase nickel incorporation protein HypB
MERVSVAKKVLSENDRIAAELRAGFHEHGIFCLNLISSPGAGKTALLEKTLEAFPRAERVAVLTGDIQTDNDARRLARFGFPVQQITTGGACHLDARMVERALGAWRLSGLDILFIENVGNLVCPTSYDLGEAAKVVLLSVAEGEDKPLKYPGIFAKAALMVLNKTDLLPHVPFDIVQARANARRIHPDLRIVEVSCTTGEGLAAWLEWLKEQRAAASAARERTSQSA